MSLILLIVLLIGFLSLSAILSASETSFFSLTTYTINSYAHDINPRKRMIANLLNSPRDLLVTIMMLNIISNILIQNTVSSLFGNFTSWFLKVGIPLVLTLFLGEVIPKSIAFPNNKFIAYKVAPFLRISKIVVTPIRIILAKITNYISRLMFFFLKKEKPLSIDELQHVLEKSKDKDILNKDEVQLIGGYLDLQDSIVREYMSPKDEVLYFNINEPIEKLFKIFSEKEVSRVPVCNNDLDNIIGIISLKRFFFYKNHIHKTQDLKKYLKKPTYIPETTRSWKLLINLRDKREDMAIVVDEYGSIAGLITQEDLIESVIGEITDKKDEQTFYTHQSKNVIIASGKMEMDDLENLFNVKIDRKTKALTVGGFLIDELGDIPQSGEKLKKDGLLFYILSSEPNKVRRVYIRKLKKGKK
ncbi:MAG: Magnesium and cobalt efflux protein CorC [Candidatus Anoxychlamydiales bacterium]|nr:Magnesium and cobalt efflux protein CorC [Candidatus Anoxychlamydiales bacterium]